MALRPQSIRAALLAGFLVIFAVWLASTYYFTGRLADSQQRNAAIHAGFGRDQDLLLSIRSQVLLGSIYVRDALSDPNEETARVARAQIRALQTAVLRERDEYSATVDAPVTDNWRRLAEEVRAYW